ncbi:MAG: hypothetical protein KIS94_04310 [Chitinophagales bacterium]|nr:hypothetical protein [Chitinophagales bacterium]
MKKVIAVACVLLAQFVQGQKMNKPIAPAVVHDDRTIKKSDLAALRKMEDSLHLLSNTITYDTLLDLRQKACYTFIPKFVEALKTENSFYYPFDSLETIAKIYPPDSSFRIFTWQLVLPKGNFRYYGVIQMKSSKLKIFPLFDAGDTMTYHSQRVTTHNSWYGCLYYNIILKHIDKKPVYTLFGYEAADLLTRRKVVDILTFDDAGKPKFGAPLFYFNVEEDSFRYARKDTLTRFFIEYKYTASTVLNYDAQLEMIVFDHVAPPTDKAKGATFTYVPDGTYEGFKWANNRWNWVERVFTFAINENDNPPIPVPLFGKPKKQPELPKEDVAPK